MKAPGISRRRLAFWAGFGLITLGERTRVWPLDDLATASILFTESAGIEVPQSDDASDQDPSRSAAEHSAAKASDAEHWALGRNAAWRWYERETLIAGRWTTSGITRPIHRKTGYKADDRDGYLDEQLVPDVVLLPKDRKRLGRPLIDSLSWQDRHRGAERDVQELVIQPQDPETMEILFGDRSESDAGRSSEQRRSRHGRPPSEWLRSLTTDEIRIWLAKVEIQDALVSGMTFSTHLTRDHSFDADKIQGLTEAELAELHGAAHAGF